MSIEICEWTQKNEEEVVDLDANVVDITTKEFHVQNEEEEKNNKTSSFEEYDNNINDKHKAGEGGDDFQSANTHL